jgi:UDP-2,3-diacylglucosamine pyrophosphatase LpxH
VQYVGRFEEAVAWRAAERGADGVVCGHIHRPEIRRIATPTGAALYANCGDWVESCTALVEHADGELAVVRWADARARAAAGREATPHAGDGLPAPEALHLLPA